MSQGTLEIPADEELMAAIAMRDEDAFSQLYDRYSGQMYAICLRILRRPLDAQAVLSEVFWEVWRNAEKFNPKRGFARTYLVMLARSRAIDRLRRDAGQHNREAGLHDIAVADADADQYGQDPAGLAVADEQSRLVTAALNELPQAQQEALRLAYFEGLTQREISERLKAPLGTIKTHIRQGLLRLARHLRAVGADWTEP